jgi:hypothetical protein
VKSGVGGITLDFEHYRYEAVWVYHVESESLVVWSPCVR